MTRPPRTCPRCGTTFTPAPPAGRKKFCTSRCRSAYNRAAATRARNTAATSNGTSTGTANGTGTGTGNANGDGTGTGTANGMANGNGNANGDGTTSAQACPHCRKPITTITWIVPPAAATVGTPAQHAADTPPTRRHGP